MRLTNCARWVLAGVAATAGLAKADFTGQPILGPLANGSSVFNDTTGKADDNDGFTSGFHPWQIWDGGDDVFKLNWLGGDMTVTLINIASGADNDLFVYRPTDLNDTSDYSTLPGNVQDVVSIFGAAPGAYYINVDSQFFSEGSYQLVVTPAPGTASLVGVAMLGTMRRRRR